MPGQQPRDILKVVSIRRVHRTAIFQPHAIGRWPLVAIFVMATLVFAFLFAPAVFDRENLPPQQQAEPEAVPVAFVVAFSLALLWNAYWFLVGCACEVRFDGETVTWQSGFRSGSMHVDEITEIRRRFRFAPTIFSASDSVGLFPAKGMRTFIEEVVRTRPELMPQKLGLLADQAEAGRRSRLRFETTLGETP